ncbi:hypothetical protein NMY22_g16253 [Coprinellus aureogranulatus]|nr:hypothetical protein NMY22_g16253 [Coprinellus aureogranulatus]
MADVEMKDDHNKKAEDAKQKAEEETKPEPLTPAAEIKQNAAQIERAVSTLEPRFTHRVLRSLTALRKKVDEGALRTAVDGLYSKDSETKKTLLSWLPEASSTSSDESMEIDSSGTKNAEPVPEVEALNRRSMDAIAAKVWFAVMRAYELGGDLAEARPLFLAAQRTASLRHDDEAQASLINCLLRSYITYNLYSQADKLVAKTTFPPFGIQRPIRSIPLLPWPYARGAAQLH